MNTKQANGKNDSSMEDILSSIKDIIASEEDPELAELLDKPDTSISEESEAFLRQQQEEEERLRREEEERRRREEEERAAREARELEEEEDVLELTDVVEGPSDIHLDEDILPVENIEQIETGEPVVDVNQAMKEKEQLILEAHKRAQEKAKKAKGETDEIDVDSILESEIFGRRSRKAKKAKEKDANVAQEEGEDGSAEEAAEESIEYVDREQLLSEYAEQDEAGESDMEMEGGQIEAKEVELQEAEKKESAPTSESDAEVTDKDSAQDEKTNEPEEASAADIDAMFNDEPTHSDEATTQESKTSEPHAESQEKKPKEGDLPQDATDAKKEKEELDEKASIAEDAAPEESAGASSEGGTDIKPKEVDAMEESDEVVASIKQSLSEIQKGSGAEEEEELADDDVGLHIVETPAEAHSSDEGDDQIDQPSENIPAEASDSLASDIAKAIDAGSIEDAPIVEEAEEIEVEQAPSPPAAQPTEKKEDFVSDEVRQKTTNSINQLMDAMKTSQETQEEPGSSLTVDNLVRELMRPIVKEWLDEHLSDIVQKTVEKEIQRIIRQMND